MKLKHLIGIVGFTVFCAFINKDNNIFNTEPISKLAIFQEQSTVDKLKNDYISKRKDKLSSIVNRREWFLAYKQFLKECSNWYTHPETIYDYFTDSEIYLMERCIETETYGSNFEAKCNVASVILNRLRSPLFPNVVDKVIVPGQFAFGRKDITEDTILALEYAFMVGDTTNGALFFHSNKKTNTFNGAEYLFTDNVGHHFYK